MAAPATTRLSLLVRIRDPEDADAWVQFVEIYAPLIHSFAMRRGLQDADAQDLTQDVLRTVSGVIDRFDYDPEAGKFRSWLLTVAKYTLSGMRKLQRRQPVGAADSAAHRAINLQESDEPDARFWNEQYTRRVFELAADRVRPSVKHETWRAFWLTAVERREPALVADELGIKIGSVYVAKTRVLARLQLAISEIADL